MIHPPARLRTLGLAALIGLSTLGAAHASPLPGSITYSTWGDVGATAGVPLGPIGFDGVYQQTPLLAPGSFSLGQFRSEALPAGAGLTYHNMPFYISLNFYSPQYFGGHVPQSELWITGVLNGTVTGATQSDVIATVSSIQPIGPGALPFPLSSFHVDAPQLLGPPGPYPGAATTLNARIDAVPEPTSCAVFALALGAGLYQLRRSRRAGGQGRAGSIPGGAEPRPAPTPVV